MGKSNNLDSFIVKAVKHNTRRNGEKTQIYWIIINEGIRKKNERLIDMFVWNSEIPLKIKFLLNFYTKKDWFGWCMRKGNVKIIVEDDEIRGIKSAKAF